MSIMITGGTGFLGSYLARHLVQEKGETGLVLYDLYPSVSSVDDIKDQVHIVRGGRARAPRANVDHETLRRGPRDPPDVYYGGLQEGDRRPPG